MPSCSWSGRTRTSAARASLSLSEQPYRTWVTLALRVRWQRRPGWPAGASLCFPRARHATRRSPRCLSQSLRHPSLAASGHTAAKVLSYSQIRQLSAAHSEHPLKHPRQKERRPAMQQSRNHYQVLHAQTAQGSTNNDLAAGRKHRVRSQVLQGGSSTRYKRDSGSQRRGGTAWEQKGGVVVRTKGIRRGREKQCPWYIKWGREPLRQRSRARR